MSTYEILCEDAHHGAARGPVLGIVTLQTEPADLADTLSGALCEECAQVRAIARTIASYEEAAAEVALASMSPVIAARVRSVRANGHGTRAVPVEEVG